MSGIDHDRWGEFNAAQADREVRPLAMAAARLAGEPGGRTAVELGCGLGREAEYLADLGWRVRTFDADPTVVDHLARVGATKTLTHTLTRLQDLGEVPACDLLLACNSLPFLAPDEFARLWQAGIDALSPGGVLAVDLFGDRDDWAGGDGTHFTRAQVEALVADLDIVALDEDEYDGTAMTGPKHWHRFQVVARRP